MSQATAPLAAGSKIAGRYEIVRLLGEGAMGQVYEASGPEGLCALKTLSSLASEPEGADRRQRFAREARLASGLCNPHVVQVQDAGVDDALGIPFLVMELLKGFDLEQLVERVGPLIPRVAVRIVLQAATGLSAAHEAGIVHRDVKPSNLFLHQVSEREVLVKVCDFGMAKGLDSSESITRSGVMLGTPLFMAPEQVSDAKHVDKLADIWSLGMTLDYALSGAPALASRSSMPDLMMAVLRGEVSLVTARAPWVDPALAEALQWALRRPREDRCPSLAAWSERLLPFQGPERRLTVDQLTAIPDGLRVSTVSGDEDTISAGEGGTPPAAPPTDPLLGATLGGRYRIDRLLGKGGMGAVYQATDSEGNQVAFKVLLDPGERSPELTHRFLREARALTAIQSPHVVRVLAADTDAQSGIHFIVMELLKGTTLSALCRSSGPLEPGPALRLFVQACSGLQAAHQRGIIHRDIKPSNLFLHELPNGEVAMKICDFGVAKRTRIGETEDTTVELTHTGGVLGSPVYMSPEQARSAKKVDAKTDIWSLGMSLWEALSGQRPWQGCTSVGELIIAICTQELQPLREIAPWLDPAIAEAVHKALEREPSERVASADELARLLEPIAAPGPVLRSDLTAVQDRSPRPDAAVTASSKATTTGRLSSTSSRSASRLVLPLAAVALLAVGGVSVWGFRTLSFSERSGPVIQGSQSPSSPAATPLQSASSVAAARGFLAVVPPSAAVKVDGVERSVADGGVWLEGSPNQRFAIVASLGPARWEGDVRITAEGKTEPERVEIARGPGKTQTAGATRADAGASTERPPTTPASVPTTAKPPPTPSNTGTGPAPVLTW